MDVRWINGLGTHAKMTRCYSKCHHAYIKDNNFGRDIFLPFLMVATLKGKQQIHAFKSRPYYLKKIKHVAD